MCKRDISGFKSIDGFISACLVDIETGLDMANVGKRGVKNLELEAAASVEVVQAKRNAIDYSDLDDDLDEMMITLSNRIVVLHPLKNQPNVLLHVAVDRSKANMFSVKSEVKKFAGDFALLS